MSVLPPSAFDCPAESEVYREADALLRRAAGMGLAVYTNDADHLREMEERREPVGGPIPVLFDHASRYSKPEHTRRWLRCQVLGPPSLAQAIVCLLETCDRYHSPAFAYVLEASLDAYTFEHIESSWALGGKPALVTLVQAAVKRQLCSGGDVPGTMIMRH